jgi:peptide/nickel transport system ATP-binding protein
MIAMALACNPKLLIADEPTTALDVTIQAQILDLIRQLRDERRMSVLFITHDLGVIAEIADHVAVMFRGRLVEVGPVERILTKPTHPYTRGLLACRPRLDQPYDILPTIDDFTDVTEEDDGVTFEDREADPARMALLVGFGRTRKDHVGPPILEVTDLSVHFPLQRDLFGRTKSVLRAVDGVSFGVWPGETLGLVGESGCGKTTLGRAILRLVVPTAGQVVFGNRVRGSPIRADSEIVEGRERLDLGTLTPHELKRVRKNLQIVFQDPYASLDPRLTVEEALTEPMIVHGIGTSDVDRQERAAALLEEVDLKPSYLRRYPHEFSGGQRQRICIARTLALEPEFIVCDESVSALDVSVQAQVDLGLDLLRRLQASRGLTYIFVSHDLAVVKFMSDVMCVMQDGRFVETGPADEVYAHPREPYTQRLIEAIPRIDVDRIRARQAARMAASLPPSR